MPADAATGRNAAYIYDGKVKEKVLRFVVSQRPLPSYLLRLFLPFSLHFGNSKNGNCFGRGRKKLAKFTTNE
jgi:hypothetical protein